MLLLYDLNVCLSLNLVLFTLKGSGAVAVKFLHPCTQCKVVANCCSPGSLLKGKQPCFKCTAKSAPLEWSLL